MLHYGRFDETNINGTCHELDACLENGISRLVYVSTYSVVFGGKEIVNVNEALPYFPVGDHVDPYGRSKSACSRAQRSTLQVSSSSNPLGKFYFHLKGP